MSLLEELNALGADTADALDRIMGDTELYEVMLGMFVSSIGDASISLDEFDGDDLDGLIRKIHALKGTTGNLALTPLFEGYNRSLELLRSGQPAQAKAAFEQMLPVQAKILDCINQHKNG